MPAEQFVGMRLGVDNAAYLNKMRASTRETEGLARSVGQLDRELRSLDRRDINIRATLTGPSAVDVARLKETHRALTDLRGLGDTQLRVGLSAPGQGQLARLEELRSSVRSLDGQTARIHVEVTGDRVALANLAEVQRATARTDGTATVRIHTTGEGEARASLGRVNLAATTGIGLLGGIGASALGAVAVLPQAISLLSATAAGVTALAGSLGLAAAAGAGFVPIVGAVGQGLASLKIAGGATIGVLELQSAVFDKAAAGGTAYNTALEKYRTALAKLPPEQRAFVEQVEASRQALERAGEAAGEELFRGLGDTLRNATTSLLPLFQTSLMDTSRIANQTGRDLVDRLAGPLRTDVAGALTTNNAIMQAASPIVGDLTSAALSLYNAAGPLAVRIAEAAARTADLLDRSAQAGQESGRLADFFMRAGDAAASLGRTAGDLGGGLLNVFRIGTEGSGQLLGGLERVAARFESWTSSVAGETALRRWFDDGREAAAALGGLIADARREFAGLTENANAADTINGLREALPVIAEFVRQITGAGETGQAFGRALRSIGEALAEINAGGAIRAFFDAASGLLTTVADIVTAVPGGTAVIGGLAIAIGGLKAAQVVLGPIQNLGLSLGKIATPAGLAVTAVGLLGVAMGQAKQDAEAFEDRVRALADLPPLDLLGSAKLEDNRAQLQGIIREFDDYKIGLQGAMDVDTGELSRLGERADLAKDALRRLDERSAILRGNVELLSERLGLTREEVVKLAEATNVDLGAVSADAAQSSMFVYQREIARANEKQREFNTTIGSFSAQPWVKYSQDVDASLNDVADRLEKDNRARENWHKNLVTVSDRAGTDVARILSEMGEEGVRITAKMATGTDAEVARMARALRDNARIGGEGQNRELGIAFEITKALGQKGSRRTAELVRIEQEIGTREFRRVTKEYGINTDAAMTESKRAGATGSALVAEAIAEAQRKGVRDTRAIASGYGSGLAGALNPVLRSLGKRAIEFAQAIPTGGRLRIQAQGGIEAPAGRENHIAQIARPGDWRVWAEPETGGEAYIPLAPTKRTRSREIAKETVKRLGGVAQFADGGLHGGGCGCGAHDAASVPGTGQPGRYQAAMTQKRYEQLLKDREVTFTGGGGPLSLSAQASKWDNIADLNVRTGGGKNPVEVVWNTQAAQQGGLLGRYSGRSRIDVFANAGWNGGQAGQFADARNMTLLHELGHAVSLSHSRTGGVAMNPTINRGWRAPQAEDRRRLRAAFPERGDDRVTPRRAQQPVDGDAVRLPRPPRPDPFRDPIAHVMTAGMTHAYDNAQAWVDENTVVMGGPGGPGGGPEFRGPVGRSSGWGTRPHVAAVGKIVQGQFNLPGGIGGYRRGTGDHGKGLALDLMTSRLGGGPRSEGDRLAAFGMRNRDKFRLKYIIWNMKIASGSRGWAWRPYTRYGSNPGNTLGHRDHNHWSFYNNGGIRDAAGHAGSDLPRMHAGGTVHAGMPRSWGLRPDERAAVLQVGERVQPRGHSYGPQWVQRGIGPTVSAAAQGQQITKQDIAALVQAVQDSRPPIGNLTVQHNSDRASARDIVDEAFHQARFARMGGRRGAGR